MRRIVGFGVTCLLVLGAGVALADGGEKVAPPRDMPFDHPVSDPVFELYKAGLAEGYPDGTFRPGQPMTRLEVALVVARLLWNLDKIVRERTVVGELAKRLENEEVGAQGLAPLLRVPGSDAPQPQGPADAAAYSSTQAECEPTLTGPHLVKSPLAADGISGSREGDRRVLDDLLQRIGELSAELRALEARVQALVDDEAPNGLSVSTSGGTEPLGCARVASGE